MLSLDFNNELIKAAPIVGTGVADVSARLFFGLRLSGWGYVADIALSVVPIGS
ncbi:type II holin, partial [Xylella fastidiosa subsp. multiplex]|nr:type II holin [Xylella fastidiosa subsp. multiplex]